MPIRNTSLIPSSVTRTLICVDKVINGDYCGRLYNLYMRRPHEFKSIFHFIRFMERFFDHISYPQAVYECRFFTPLTSKRKMTEGEVRRYMSEEVFETERGDKATFLVQVQFRQNASWQGTITWTEEKKTLRFRSMLEMVRLMDSALDAQDSPVEESW